MAKKKTKGEDYGTIYEQLAALEAEKGIDSKILAEKIKFAIEKSLKANPQYDEDEDCLQVDVDLENQRFEVSVLKVVVKNDEIYCDPNNDIFLDEALKIDPNAKVDDKVRVPIDTKMFKRIAAKNAKDLIRQGFSNAERQRLSEIWGDYENQAVSAKVTKIEPVTNHVTLEIGGNEVMLMKDDQIPGETFNVGQSVKVHISGVSKEYKEGDKNQYLRVSRTDKWLVKRLFELECPEIADGTVEIKSVSRAPGSRSKIAVMSNDPNVDAVGTCIGPELSRIKAVTKEIKGEKVDVVLYSDDPEEFIKQALKPAEVLKVIISNPNPGKKACKAIVPDNQLSLAIGNKGQNAWLAAKLTGYRIDIKSESNVVPEDYETVPLEEKPEETEPETTEAAASAE